MYKCKKCGEEFDKLPKGGVIRCPSCAYKILLKLRSPIVKEIKAR